VLAVVMAVQAEVVVDRRFSPKAVLGSTGQRQRRPRPPRASRLPPAPYETLAVGLPGGTGEVSGSLP
jgi:hypothetical protein